MADNLEDRLPPATSLWLGWPTSLSAASAGAMPDPAPLALLVALSCLPECSF